MTRINKSDKPCPECLAIGGLWIEPEVLVTLPLGSFSLSGAQFKTTGRFRPVLHCDGCGLELPGEYDGDDHAVFPRPPVEGSLKTDGTRNT
jgi:hypothetical protein